MHDVIEHLDDLGLLGFSAGAFQKREARAIAAHLAGCGLCRRAFEGVRTLDAELRELARAGHLAQDLASATNFPPGDAFRRRPKLTDLRRNLSGADSISASERGFEAAEAVLESALNSATPTSILSTLRLERPDQRFALYYALQLAARRLTENPLRGLEFANAVLGLPPASIEGVTAKAAEAAVPWIGILGQAHLLASQANLWRKDFAEAGVHLGEAYRALAEGGDEAALAIVELTESQRRSFLGRGNEALALAQRAQFAFGELGLDDFKARADVAVGLASVALGQFDVAIAAYRKALPVFEQLELWNNYVGAVNSLATALYRVGRLDEARREFARVLRHLSRDKHRSWLGFVRHGLGDVLFSAERFREAALSFDHASRLYAESGLRASALTAQLAAAESWGRSGSPVLARERLERVGRDVREAQRDKSLDQSVIDVITNSLSHATADVDGIADLRRTVHQLINTPRQ